MASLHIVAIPLPVSGHMNPCMHFCRRLVQQISGLKVTFVTIKEREKDALRARDLVATQKDSSSTNEHIRVVAMGSFPTFADYMYSHTEMSPVLEEFLHRSSAEGDPVVCIIGETSCGGWVQEIAIKFKIPGAIFCSATAVTEMFHSHTEQLLNRKLIPVSECNSKDEVIDFIPGLAPFRAVDLPLIFHHKEHAIYYPMLIEGAKAFKKARFGFCNSLEQFEPEMLATIRREMKANYFCVGPSISPDFLKGDSAYTDMRSSLFSQEDTLCLEWLDKQEDHSVLYISFGSVDNIPLEQARVLARSLEITGLPFLFVLRNNFHGFPLKHSDHDFQEMLQWFNMEKGLVVSWAPQMQVLLHSAVGGFLTHCGWNSTLEAICAGVPMLAWPLGAEQNINAREIVGKWNIGLEVHGKMVNEECLPQLMKTLMTNERLRDSSSRLRDMVKRASAPGGSLSQNIEAFVQALASPKPS